MYVTVAVKHEQLLVRWMSAWGDDYELPHGAVTSKRDRADGDHQQGLVRLGGQLWDSSLRANGHPTHEAVTAFLATEWGSACIAEGEEPDLHTSCFFGGQQLSYALKYADDDHIRSRAAGSKKRDCFVAFRESPTGNAREVTVGRVVCFAREAESEPVQIVYESFKWLGHEIEDESYPGLSSSAHMVALSAGTLVARPVTDVHSRVAMLNIGGQGLRAVVVPKFASNLDS